MRVTISLSGPLVWKAAVPTGLGLGPTDQPLSGFLPSHQPEEGHPRLSNYFCLLDVAKVTSEDTVLCGSTPWCFLEYENLPIT